MYSFHFMFVWIIQKNEAAVKNELKLEFRNVTNICIKEEKEPKLLNLVVKSTLK